MNTVVIPASAVMRLSVLSELRARLKRERKTIPEAIADKDLYFRISLVGTCNLSCQFCHNEGAPVSNRMDLEFATRAIKAAAEVGFTRVQFTGGEPLLHPEVVRFVENAKRIVADVGITTNGTFLEKKIESLIKAETTRIHVSLQVESLVDAGVDGQWGVPKWLETALACAADGGFILRLNMPVPANMFQQASAFLETMSAFGSDLKVFSILPEGDVQGCDYPLEQLNEIVDRENRRRKELKLRGRVFIRSFRPPAGSRCGTCVDFSRCKEQSHSLRLGADHMLRPCLATRKWDSELKEGNMKHQLQEAALLALDF